MDGIFLVNKEKGFTSRDVVNKISKKFNIKKVGHTGTLDPIATGVLIIVVGKCTKLVNELTSTYKEYVATMKLGIQTDTGDITGTVVNTKEFLIDKQKIEKVLKNFKKTYIQTVPIYSAKKVNGKKLYEYARSNEKVNLPKQKVTIKDIKLINIDKNLVTFKTTVSKGCYIRSLIEDIATSLNTYATMVELKRTKQGKFKIENCLKVDEVNKNNLLNIYDILDDYIEINLDKSNYKNIINGNIIDKFFKEKYCFFKYNDKLISIYKEYENNKAKPFIMYKN